MSLAWRALAVGAALAPSSGALAAAQLPARESASPASADAAFAAEIQRLTRGGDWAGAILLLDSRPDLSARADVIRLRASLLHQLGRSTQALALLERRLTQDPDDALARFEVGEIQFEQKQDRAASLAYRLAMAGPLDALRRQAAAARLAAIDQRREWRFWAGGSVAPDSNLNSATDATRVDLFGLPFELDDAARRQSGVSLGLFGGAERRFALSGGIALRAGLIGSFNGGPGTAFDSAAAFFRAGPEIHFGSGAEISLQVSAGQRWYSGEVLETRWGAILTTEFGDERTRWTGALSADDIDDRLSNSRDGWMANADFARSHYLSPSSLWRIALSVTRREAEAPSESYMQARASVGLLLPMPFASALYLEPYIMDRRHDEASFAFGVVREDIEVGASLRLSKRDWTILGAHPFLSATLMRSESTVEIGDYSRERVEFGLTREF